MNDQYTKINSDVIDSWVRSGWEWGKSISHEVYEKALRGEWSMLLTPVKPVPKKWFGELNGSRVLGLASGGGQQMPIFAALGAICTVLDYSKEQLESEKLVAQREGYQITTVHADMTKPLPFEDESFDVVFHPVSNCYVEDVMSIWHECYRVLRKGGILLCGLDNGLNFAYDENETQLQYTLPFNPLVNEKQYSDSLKNDWGIQFSHTVEEQLGGQLAAGFTLTGIYQDTNNSGTLHDHNIPCYYATRAVKR